MKAANKEVLLSVIPLDVLVKEFVKENKFSKPKSIIDTSKGKLIFWNDNSQVILYSKISNVGWRSHPYLGRSGIVFSKTIDYCLEGVLEGKKVKLEAEVSKTNYSSILHKNRKDDLDYWFITKSKKQELLIKYLEL